MKITKIRTKMGELQSPVSTELEAVVESMRSDDTKQAADVIARDAMYSRLMMEQGAPRYHLNGTDALPYLLFSATFGAAGWMMSGR